MKLMQIIYSRLPVSRKIHTRVITAITEITMTVIKPPLPSPPNDSAATLSVETTSIQFVMPAIIRPARN